MSGVCSCHPDDAVVPCQHKYAASDCQAAHNESVKQRDAPAVPGAFEPTDEDVKHLAVALLANLWDTTFRDASERFTFLPEEGVARWLGIARTAFAHPGYLPSIERARSEANQSRAVEVAELRAEIARLTGRISVLKQTVDNQHSADTERVTQFNVVCRERDDAKAYAQTIEGSLNRALHDLGNALAEVHDMKKQMAAFTAANVSPRDPKPGTNPFRGFPRDPRLMGTPQRLT
jgi:hypothetical protein